MAEEKHRCEDCGARKYAEAHPESLRAPLALAHGLVPGLEVLPALANRREVARH
jgi:hypothetical protein